jgi:hypothetical protein
MERFKKSYLLSDRKGELEARIRLPEFFTLQDKRLIWLSLKKHLSSISPFTSEKYEVVLFENDVRKVTKDNQEKYELKERIAFVEDDEIYSVFVLSSETKIEKEPSGLAQQEIRKIDRTSFIYSEYRIDLSEVQSKKDKSYEIEIEWLKLTDDAIEKLYNITKDIYQRLMGTKIFYTNKQRNWIMRKLTR